MSEKKYPIKWEYKSHSCQIADTGDYDGYWEVTNGKDSLITKEDYEDIEKDLQAVVDLLNNTYANFTFDRDIEAALEAENKWLKSELEQYKARPGAVWVRASERLPEPGKIIWRWMDKTEAYAGYKEKGGFIYGTGGASVDPTYYSEIEWLDKSESPAEQPVVSQDAHEKEVMMQLFDKVRKLFEGREWIMEGRGSYPYNDDRYKEEVRYLYDEFDTLQKDTWKNIQTKSFEYRKAIIAEYQAEQPVREVEFAEWILKEKFETIQGNPFFQSIKWNNALPYSPVQLYQLFKEQKQPPAEWSGEKEVKP